MLLAAYQPAAPSYRQIFLRRDFRDFKPHRHLRVGDFPTLMGVFDLTKEPALAIAAGVRVFWDNTNRRITATANRTRPAAEPQSRYWLCRANDPRQGIRAGALAGGGCRWRAALSALL
jgi:hypothetical protein